MKRVHNFFGYYILKEHSKLHLTMVFSGFRTFSKTISILYMGIPNSITYYIIYNINDNFLRIKYPSSFYFENQFWDRVRSFCGLSAIGRLTPIYPHFRRIQNIIWEKSGSLWFMVYKTLVRMIILFNRRSFLKIYHFMIST